MAGDRIGHRFTRSHAEYVNEAAEDVLDEICPVLVESGREASVHVNLRMGEERGLGTSILLSVHCGFLCPSVERKRNQFD
jgi:hypothetical protein